MNWYNEINPYAARWLRNLIDGGEIAPGVVDERDIRDVCPTELVSFDECHFFAGVGVWSRALRDAERNSNRRLKRPVWTGSCPCQPFSQAGRGDGFADERHLWPAFDWLIGQSAPGVILGEQVEGADGLMWLDLVLSDLEARGYACGAAVFPAACIGAPHIRSRTYWLAHAERAGRQGRLSWGPDQGRRDFDRHAGRVGATGWLADADGGDTRAEGLQRSGEHRQRSQDGRALRREYTGPWPSPPRAMERPGTTNGVWRDADWIFCRDGYWRPIEPGSFPLAHGAAARVGRVRAYGNAICLPQATAFIETVMEVLQ